MQDQLEDDPNIITNSMRALTSLLFNTGSYYHSFPSNAE